MIILKTAWKNIWRKRTRSIVVLTAITIGLSCGLLSAAISTGFVKQLVDSVIFMETSHIVMQADSFYVNNDIRYYMPDSNIIKQEIKKTTGVQALSDRLKIPGYISSAHASQGIDFIGVIPEKDMQVFELHSMIPDSKGSFFADNISHPIVIGRTLSNSLNVDVNHRLVATFQSIDGDLVSSMFRVAGIFEIENYLFERTSVFVLKDELSFLSGLDPFSSHEISIKTTGSLPEVNYIMADLSEKFPDNQFLAWYDIRPEVGVFYFYIGLLNMILVGIILVALSFGIINNMLTVVIERKHEIGMLRAIGMNDKKVFAMVMLETILLVFTGVLISMIVSLPLLHWLGETGINMGLSPSSLSEIIIGAERVYPQLDIGQYIKIAIMVSLTGIIAAVYPMKQVLKTSPADALRRLN